MSSFYQIKLFEFAKIFDTFYSNLLKKASENSLSKQINEFTLSVIINDEKKWKIDDILNPRKHYRRIQFLIKWKEHDENKNWYNFDKFDNVIDIVKDFYERYSDKSKSDWLKQQSNQKIWWFKEQNNVTNISFVFKLERVDVRSRHRKIVLSKDRVIERSTSFCVIERLSHHRYVMKRRSDEKDRKWWMLDVIKKTFWFINTSQILSFFLFFFSS